MGFSQENGYVPSDIQTIMLSLMGKINDTFGTTYTEDSFVGTNFYKYFYALAQRLQEQEVKTSEIFLKLQEYANITNQKIQRPVVTPPGIIENLGVNGYLASVKPMVVGDAGKISICVLADDGVHATADVTITSYANLVSGSHDVVTVNGTAFTAQSTAVVLGAGTFQAATSNAATAISLAAQINGHATAGAIIRARAAGAKVYLRSIQGGTAGNAYTLGYTDNDTNVGATKSGTVFSGGTASATYAAAKLAICTLIKDMVVGGVISQGSEGSTIVLSNGQSFDFKFFLPNKIPIKLKLTTYLSENNEVVIGIPDDVKAALAANINSRYALGKDFAPQKYFSVVDAPWAESVLLEWSDDGGTTYYSTVYRSIFDDLFTFDISDITLVES